MCENMGPGIYHNLFGDLWESGRYEQAIEIYEFLGRPFYLAEDIGRYYENNGLIDRAMGEYGFLIESYLKMGDDFLPFPGGPVELFKVGRWYEKTDPMRAEKYLKLYLSAEPDKYGTGRGIDHKTEAQGILAKIQKTKQEGMSYERASSPFD